MTTPKPFKTTCNSCGYERKPTEVKRKHRCPACNEAYIFAVKPRKQKGFIPNRIPYDIREVIVGLAVFLFLYGTVGIILDDIYLPGGRGGGIHVHGVMAWLIYGSILSVCFSLMSLFVDHYDTRDNERIYDKAFLYGIYASIAFFVAFIVYGSL